MLHLGLHQHHPSRQRRARKTRRLSQGDHPQRARFRLALCDFRDRHLQHRVRLGASPEEQDRGRVRGCRKVISDLAQTAYDHGAVFLLESYVNNVVGSVEETVKMFAQVDHPGLGLLMDPTNYFEAHNIDRMDQVLNQVFDTLADKIRIAHAKDVKRSGSDKTEKHADIGDADAHEGLTFRGVGEIELPAPGLGSLNYDLYLQRLSE